MKIAMISEHANPLAPLGGPDAGGQNLHVAELSTALVNAGHTVTVYTRRDNPGTPERVLAPGGYRVVHVPAGPPARLPKDQLLAHMGEFGRFLAREWTGPSGPPDVTHAHFWMSGVASLLAAEPNGIPVVLTYHALGLVKRRHQGDRDTSPKERIPIELDLGRRVNRVIAQCSDEQRELVEMGVPPSSVAIVPSGVDCDRFHPDGPVAPKSGRTRVLTVGRLVARKGFADLIRAVRWLPEAELAIIGGSGIDDAPERARLLDLARRLGVADRVRLVGAVAPPDMPAWYRSADVVACAPWYEPFGLTPLEAMACGVPVVAYAVGGLADTVVDGVTGLHVPPQNVEALAHQLRVLASDPVRRRRFGQAAVGRARQRYPWSATAARLVEIYGSVVRRPMACASPWERP